MQIVALVGPSGTGKSHRASMVADHHKADAIIDDGLLIVDGRIVAGRSAKREQTRMAAVKRAIFHASDHAREVREALRASPIETLLVLGTSRNMVRHILHALELDGEPVTWVDINSVATPEEIETALRVRAVEGKHVIPAPTFEVQKSFSGYLVAPLRFMFPGRARPMVVEKSIVRPTFSSFGRLYIAEPVVRAIAAYVARHAPGVAKVLKVAVTTGQDGVAVDLEVAVAHPRGIFAVLAEVQRGVRQAIESSTALNVMGVHVAARRWVRGPRGGGEMLGKRDDRWKGR